jgi:hypothetical protein
MDSLSKALLAVTDSVQQINEGAVNESLLTLFSEQIEAAKASMVSWIEGSTRESHQLSQLRQCCFQNARDNLQGVLDGMRRGDPPDLDKLRTACVWIERDVTMSLSVIIVAFRKLTACPWTHGNTTALQLGLSAFCVHPGALDAGPGTAAVVVHFRNAVHLETCSGGAYELVDDIPAAARAAAVSALFSASVGPKVTIESHEEGVKRIRSVIGRKKKVVDNEGLLIVVVHAFSTAKQWWKTDGEVVACGSTRPFSMGLVVKNWCRQVVPKGHGLCVGCGLLVKKPRVCSGCHIAEYCSEECQKSNWGVHKPLCQKVQAGLKAT